MIKIKESYSSLKYSNRNNKNNNSIKISKIHLILIIEKENWNILELRRIEVRA